MKIRIPYYNDNITINIPEKRIKSVLEPETITPHLDSQESIIEEALKKPIDSPQLSAISFNKKRILIISSDHTRPVPSRITIPIILKHIRKENPDAQVRILIATGVHRETTRKELLAKFGATICNEEEIIVHNAFNAEELCFKGELPSGGKLYTNKLTDWADLIIAEGFIEPHFFAGFSGGRKSILPGICSRETIMYNHNAKFIAHPNARTGCLEGNPLHEDMLFAAKKVGLSFILNVTLDKNKKITAAFAGDPVNAHLEGCRKLEGNVKTKAVKAPIVVTSNGGYPLDQNIYQSVKGMTAAESCISENGIIIMISSCCDGHGGDGFWRWFKNSPDAEDVWNKISSITPKETKPDQWQAQILSRIQKKCKKVIIVSKHTDPQIIRDMHMLHAETFDQALSIADEILGSKEQIVIIPDGVGIIIQE